MKLLNLDWSMWFYGMWVAFATGASNSVIAGLTLKVMDDTVFNREPGTMLKYVGSLFVIGAVKDFFLYINAHPAPAIVSQDTRASVHVEQLGDGTLTKTVKTRVEETVAREPEKP